MSFQDLVKFITQQLVMRMHESKEERKAKQLEKKEYRPPLSHHAFGSIPVAMSIAWKNSKIRAKLQRSK
ncbi:YqzE family protein [Halalkalibacterium halodurans]|jgi:hypothetical protein|uniref:YqzE-like protein n=1 Tax=Halalkalibacterium halodurans TaxID=86665 RepID=A0A0M0KHX6_ALKHA|nr:YqzE family protein [Halalkalibacterium halodurans]MDY7223375.1 YqzE family protein [Halalkalibacterium halodurans]MDY7242596.1 YqzE family protein [Halalkalibacterium halodurans]MED4162492.1 YqzE family protein [Halalkalibacterium halodurans]TPE65863.1 YqzE family protein [Halalkalibacterium halodurans]